MSGKSPNLTLPEQKRQTRSQGSSGVLLLQQKENVAMLLDQCTRGQHLVTQSEAQLPGPIQLRRRIKAIEEAWIQCSKCHNELAAWSEEETVRAYFVAGGLESTRASYLDVLEKLDVLQDRLHTTTPVTLENTMPDDIPTTSTRFTTLERIPIPSFDGDAKDWPAFQDMFTSLVINEVSLTNVHRFYYLKRALKGNALALISNMSVTNENFSDAWKIVKDHYQDVQVLTFSYLVQLLKLEPVNSGKIGHLERLVIQTREILASLSSLGEPIEEWSSILVVLTLLRLDSDLRRDWERFVGKRASFPKYSELEKFLQARVHSENVACIKSGVSTHSSNHSASSLRTDQRACMSKLKVNAHVSTTHTPKCLICNAAHSVASCKILIKLSPEERLKKIRSLRCCYNCLRVGHFPRECRIRDRCSVCSRLHNTLLHEALALEFSTRNTLANDEEHHSRSPPAVSTVSSNTANQVHLVEAARSASSKSVLLATALVRVSTRAGRVATFRALIDQGSERSFISESAAQALRVVRKSVNASIVGLGGQPSGHVKFATDVKLTPVLNDQPVIEVQCLILSKLTSYIPRQSVQCTQWTYVNQLPLADPEPASDKAIDLLLGADVYGDLILEGVFKSPNEPVAQCTVFGWILSGPYPNSPVVDSQQVIHSFHVASNAELNQSLNKFWDIEEIPKEQFLSEDDRICEELFVNTTVRDNSGRYQVSLPFKCEPPIDLGESYVIAQKQYLRLERRLTRDPQLKEAYHSFLKEYLDLGHMTRYIPTIPSEQVCYIPHHPVIKSTSSTTKVRVVFNASSQTSNGRSLNDNLFVGRKLQQDLTSVIMRWRFHKYVMVADVEKMFRQIKVHPDHSRYQLILWRPDEASSIQVFRLTTVTYGTAPAPYLALRVLYQLAADEQVDFPLAAEELLENTYVDDIVFGSSNLNKVRNMRDQLLTVTSKGGLLLRKWSTNFPELLQDIPADQCEASSFREFNHDNSLKVLGISWDVVEDCFRFSSCPELSGQLTKRTLLSYISKLFDPLGWISPVIVAAKIFMQRLWLSKLDWDAPLTPPLAIEWSSFMAELLSLSDIRIPRWLGTEENPSIQLHAFCDASQLAYAAAVYVRVAIANKVQVYLLTSKTKVAPLKTLTIPRLELCAAELLSRLLLWTMESLKINPSTTKVVAWSDSQVTLTWIRGDPSRWKLFVGNRVSRIQGRLRHVCWRYVPTDSNPADLASRGLSASLLKNTPLWWHGPSWLSSSSEIWPVADLTLNEDTDMEERVIVSHLAHDTTLEIAQRSSDWGKLVRAAAVFLRYKDILLAHIRRESAEKFICPNTEIVRHYRDQALIFWIKVLQSDCFSDELTLIKRGQPLPRGNRFISLDPFIDADGIIRVSGRLAQTSLNYSIQHPIIIGNHYITKLIIRQAHQRTLHGGTSLTMRYLAEVYWLLRAKVLVRSVINKCVPCTRNRASLMSQRMADLPILRVERHRPFQHVGIDYAGPILIKNQAGRGHHAHKAYISVFVCMTTRALHIELVHDYSTRTFLAAFKRFCARRGLPSIVVSDNGTTFRGASNEIQREFRSLIQNPQIADVLANDHIEWQFIPPGAPHFGGIWEAGVKSVKYHLRRVAGDHMLTSEEMSTLLCQIEACLNSRPIAGFSTNPDDLSYLTPGHFLIGAPLLSPPEHSALGSKTSRLTRWQLIQSCVERFWKVWVRDYLRYLQTRNKWRGSQTSLSVGDLVLIKNENLPPTKWELARVIGCYPGKDGLIRVCQLRTATTTCVRPIHKLCLLPVRDNEEF